MSRRQVSKLAAAILLAILGLYVAVVVLAPPERTLGLAIRYIYVHVSLTWAGMAGFYLAGILGLVIAATASKRLQAWTQVMVLVAFGLFLGGGIFSLFAQQTSWGGLLLEEPRNRTSLSVLAATLVVIVLNEWAPWVRFRGLLYTALALFVAWIIPSTPLVLHPADAASNSSSAAIRWSFLGLTALALAAGAWLAWYFRPAQREPRSQVDHRGLQGYEPGN